MRHKGLREVQGLWFADGFRTFAWDAEAGEPGELVTEVDVDRIALGKTCAANVFQPPEGAHVTTDM